MNKQFDCLNKRLNALETLLGENYQAQLNEQNGNAGDVDVSSLVDKLNKAESRLKEMLSNIVNGTFISGQNVEIHKQSKYYINLMKQQNINEFLKNSEMKYATSIIGSKNRADLLLKQEQEIINVIEYLEQIDKNRKMISFDPILKVEERKNMVQSFEFMSEISNQGGPLKINKLSEQTIAEVYLEQNEDIEQLIKDSADIIDTINKKFLYFDAVLTQLENKK